MTAMTNIALRDDTPTTHTLIPAFEAAGKQGWRENLSTVPIDGQVTLTIQQDSLKDGTRRINVKLDVPTLETIGSSSASGYTASPKVAYKTTASCTFFFPTRSSNQDRAHMLRMLAQLIDGATATVGTTLGDPGAVTANLFMNSASTNQVAYSLVNQLFPGT